MRVTAIDFGQRTVVLQVVIARYSHKGHDTISHKISRYDTIQKCFTICKNRMLSVINHSYIVAAPGLPPFLLHPLAPLKLDMGRRVEQPRQTQCWCELMSVLLR